MNQKSLSNSLLILTVAFASIFMENQAVKAATLVNGWNIAIDPSYDSLSVNDSPMFNYNSMGIKDDGESIWVGINSNIPLTGHNVGTSYGGFSVPDGNIGNGDFFFDFSGYGNFETASNNHALYGIRFSPNNDSSASSLGVYSFVKATDVEKQNAGYWNLGYYNQKVQEKTGLNAQIGDLAINDPYYAPYTSSYTGKPMPNVIGEGQKIGDITLLNNLELLSAGFDPSLSSTQGSYSYGFKFDKSLLPNGNYIATLLAECLNDSMALVGNFQESPPPPPPPKPTSVPEPSFVLGMFVFGVLSRVSFKKRNQV